MNTALLKMGSWEKFWVKYPGDRNGNLLKQVGKTVGGVPISDEQFDKIIHSIVGRLDLQKTDHVLDLCCGNGIITNRLAPMVASIQGIDFSPTLVENARKGAPKNVIFNRANLTGNGWQSNNYGSAIKYNKVLWYDALAFFTPHEVVNILRHASIMHERDNVYYRWDKVEPAERVFLGSVLNEAKKENFYNTPARKLLHLRHKIETKLFGHDAKGIGRWWTDEEILNVSKVLGFNKFTALPQPKELHTAHYRTDYILGRTDYV